MKLQLLDHKSPGDLTLDAAADMVIAARPRTLTVIQWAVVISRAAYALRRASRPEAERFRRGVPTALSGPGSGLEDKHHSPPRVHRYHWRATGGSEG